MKLLMLFAVAALVLGGIYHDQVAQYFAGLSSGEVRTGGVMPAAGSLQSIGNSTNNLMGHVGDALSR